jgi:hypothetical protein
MRTLVTVVLVGTLFAGAVTVSGAMVGIFEDPPPIRVPEDPSAKRAAAQRKATRAKQRRAGRKAAEQRARRARVMHRWASSVNQLCRRAKAEVTALEPPETPAQAEAYLDELVALNEKYNDAVAAVPADGGNEALVNRLLALLDEEEQLLGDVLAAAQTKDVVGLSDLAQSAVGLVSEEQSLMEGLGATDCTLTDAFAPSL